MGVRPKRWLWAHNGFMTSPDSSDLNPTDSAGADATLLGNQSVPNGETVPTIMALLGGEGDSLPHNISGVGSKTVCLARKMMTRLSVDVAGDIAFVAQGLPLETLSLDSEGRSFIEPRAKLLGAALSFLTNPDSPQPKSKKQAKKEKDEAEKLSTIVVLKVDAAKPDLVRHHPEQAKKIDSIAAQCRQTKETIHGNPDVAKRPTSTPQEKIHRDLDRIAEALVRAKLPDLAERARELQRAVKSACRLDETK